MTLPQRKPNRLKAYDYASAGLYFITICTRNHRQILCRIIDAAEGAAIELTECGQIVEQTIRAIPEHYTGVSVSRYVIMPNHVHMLLDLHAEDGRMVSAPTVIGSMKRHVSRSVGTAVWQKGFYDHVIRTEADHLLHLQYIEENPRKWIIGKDEYYS